MNRGNKTRQAELIQAAAVKRRLQQDVRKQDRRIGDLLADELAENKYATKSNLGRMLGVSHTAVGNMLSIAAAAGESAQPERIQSLENQTAGRWVKDQGLRVVRHISAFDASDVLYRSELDPRLFEVDGHVDVPNVLWQLSDGSWIGVETATVGYGGTGCGFTRDALRAAGVSEGTADELIQWRFCDARDVEADPTTWDRRRIWPVYSRAMPWLMDDKVIVPFSEDSMEIADPGDSVDASGIYASPPSDSHFHEWIRFLNGEHLPDWARGERVARVFLRDEESARQGFVSPQTGSAAWSPLLVIEQGDVQLWGNFDFVPGDRRGNRYLGAEAYEALRIANVYPRELAAIESEPKKLWLRLLEPWVGTKDPFANLSFVDVSSDASSLAYVPARRDHPHQER